MIAAANENEISSREILGRYQAGERVFRDLDISDHGDEALVGADLRGIEFHDCFMFCNFAGANLGEAQIHANVKTCDFTGADLTGADFRGSALCGTTFAGAKMDGARFENAYYYGHDLSADQRPNW